MAKYTLSNSKVGRLFFLCGTPLHFANKKLDCVRGRRQPVNFWDHPQIKLATTLNDVFGS